MAFRNLKDISKEKRSVAAPRTENGMGAKGPLEGSFHKEER
jgi:hypothetical protein